MNGREERAEEAHPIVYCLVPRDLASRLHDVLRRHFQDDGAVDVVVERRATDRRRADDRRAAALISHNVERRLIRNDAGRRVGERRATTVCVTAPPLPRRAREFAPQLVFVERLEPTSQQAEDVDTARLVTRLQAGDRDAFATLYMRYFDRVYGYLRMALDDRHEAEDAAQQIFVRAMQAIPRYERRVSVPFRAWLFVIVRNYLRSELQRRSRIELVDPSSFGRAEGELRLPIEEPQLHALSWISDKDLLLFMERLPASQRQVLFLRYMLDLTPEQTAAVLGRSYEDVRKLQSRALAFLRARLAAVARGPARTRPPMVGRLRQAQVLRRRRFALSP